MLRRLQANPVKKAILVMVLPAVAGAVNSSGLFQVGLYTSHMTGNASRLGEELAQTHWGPALQMLSILGTFMFGAMVGAAVVESARDRLRARYAIGLLIEAAALAIVSFGTIASTRAGHPAPAFGLLVLLCFAMGLQNAMITRLSGAVVRTTHVTGVVTDLGIGLLHVLLWLRSRRPLLGVETLRQLQGAQEFAQLRLHATILLSFVTGNLVGALLFLHLGLAANLLPCAVVLGLSVFDLRAGLDPPQSQPLPLGAPTRSGAHEELRAADADPVSPR